MSRAALYRVLAVIFLMPLAGVSQVTAPGGQQALVLVSQALTALNANTPPTDVTLQASVTYTAGSDVETGTATLLAVANQQSRLQLNLSGGTRQEIRNGPGGDWIGPDGVEYPMALHNCWVDASWLFPGLNLQAVLSDSEVVLAYVGQKTRNGQTVQHFQVSRIVPGQTPEMTAEIQQLSTADVYLDAASFLAVAVAFNLHPDDELNANIPCEIDFTSYQTLNGMQVPMHIQKFIQGGLLLDLNLSTVTVNSGIPQTTFTIQ